MSEPSCREEGAVGAGPGSEQDSMGLSGPLALSLFLRVSPLLDPVSLSPPWDPSPWSQHHPWGSPVGPVQSLVPD